MITYICRAPFHLNINVYAKVDFIKHEHWVTVRNRFNGQKAYGKAPIVYKLARKKNGSSYCFFDFVCQKLKKH